jgi:hypothetical protein
MTDIEKEERVWNRLLLAAITSILRLGILIFVREIYHEILQLREYTVLKHICPGYSIVLVELDVSVEAFEVVWLESD